MNPSAALRNKSSVIRECVLINLIKFPFSWSPNYSEEICTTKAKPWKSDVRGRKSQSSAFFMKNLRKLFKSSADTVLAALLLLMASFSSCIEKSTPRVSASGGCYSVSFIADKTSKFSQNYWLLRRSAFMHIKRSFNPINFHILFLSVFHVGLMMLLDIPEERSGRDLDLRWGEPKDCRFPLFPFIKPLSLPRMGLVYGLMWLGKNKVLFDDFWADRLVLRKYRNKDCFVAGF